LYLCNCICIITCIYVNITKHKHPLWLKMIFFFLIRIETLLSLFHLILFTIKNVKNDQNVTFCLFYRNLHKIFTHNVNSVNNIVFSAEKIFGIRIITFQKVFAAEQNYRSRISCRILWNLTHSKYKITSRHKNNLNF